MKNLLNEEIDQIKYLLNYNRGLTLSEQKNNLLINEDTAPGGLGGKWDPSTGEYTIVKGDTLSKIGNAFGVKWMDIWEKNKNTLRSGQPNCGKYCGYNWIFVGEVIIIPGKAEAPKTTDTTTTGTTTTDTTDTTDTNVVPVVTPSGSEEEKTGKEKRQEKRAERQANRDARQSERQKRREERRAARQKRRKERSQNASIPATSTPTTPTLPNSQTADLGNAPKEVVDYLTDLLNNNPDSVLGFGETNANDRELAFKEARTKSGKTNLVGNRKVIAKPDGGYKVYAVFK